MKSAQLIPLERIQSKTYLLRGEKVMLSTHLAELEKFKELGRRVDKNTADIRMVSHMIQQLLEPPLRPPRRRIGFPPPA